MLNQPTILWAQREDYVWMTVEVPNAENIKFDLGSNSLKFRCTGDGKEYGFEMEFYRPIVKEESKYLKHRLIDICLKKAEHSEWPRLVSDNKKFPWIKVDWSKWHDSDAEDEPSGFDMSNMGNFGDFGMGPEMAGLGGMGADFSAFKDGDSDDESDELPELPVDEAEGLSTAQVQQAS